MALEVLEGEAGAKCDCVKEKGKKPAGEEGAETPQEESDGGVPGESSADPALLAFDEETKEDEQKEAELVDEEAGTSLARPSPAFTLTPALADPPVRVREY